MSNYLFMLNVDLNFLCEILMISAMVSLLWSRNNIIILLNFLSILMLLSFKLLISGVIEFTIVIIMVYQSAIIILFLVNSLHLVNLFSFELIIFSSIMFVGQCLSYFFIGVLIASPNNIIHSNLIGVIIATFSLWCFTLLAMASCFSISVPLVINLCSAICLALFLLITLLFLSIIIVACLFFNHTFNSKALSIWKLISVIFILLSLVFFIVFVWSILQIILSWPSLQFYSVFSFCMLVLWADLLAKWKFYKWVVNQLR